MFAFLRHVLQRPTDTIQHTLICGATRSGKSESMIARLVPVARRGDCALVVIDPPGTMAQRLLLHLDAHGLRERVIYDRLADTDRVPVFSWLQPSAHPNPLQRKAEDDERVREVTSILLRRRGIHDPAATPVIEEGLLAALRLYIAQHPPARLPWLTDAFERRSPLRARLLANCTDPELVRKFHEYASLSPNARRIEIAPAERILRAVLTSPAFQVRSGEPTFDLGQFLDGKGILILDGSSRGNLSRDAASVMMGAVTLQAIRHCRTGSKSPVVIVLDEALNAGLVGPYESQALAEAAKWRLQFFVLVQDPFGFPSEQVRSNVLQNTGRHEWFRQGSPEAARLAAEDIAIPLLDPLRVHHTEYRVRSIDAGYERVLTENWWTGPDGHARRGVGWNTVLWPIRREVRDPVHRYMPLEDQVRLLQRELMRLRPGFRFVRAEAVGARPEYVPMLRRLKPVFATPGGVAALPVKLSDEERFSQILSKLKARPEYRRPSDHTNPLRSHGQGAAAAFMSGRCD